jgi:hypothetical protein
LNTLDREEIEYITNFVIKLHIGNLEEGQKRSIFQGLLNSVKVPITSKVLLEVKYSLLTGLPRGRESQNLVDNVLILLRKYEKPQQST